MSELVYIVDNESGITFVLAEIVSSFGYNTKTFSNPVEALEKIHDDRPQVIISDFKMPEMHGVDFLKEVQKKNLEASFIFFSAFLTKEVVSEAIKHGAFGLMDKPFKENILRSFIENAFNHFHHKVFLNSKLSQIEEMLIKNENEKTNNEISKTIDEIRNHKIHFRF